MSEPPGWYRSSRRGAGERAPEPPAAAEPSTSPPPEVYEARPAPVPPLDTPGSPSDTPGPPSDVARRPTDVSGPPLDVVRIPAVPVARGERRRRRLMIGVGLCVAASLLVIVVIETVGRRMLQNEVGEDIRASGVAVDVDVRIGRAWWTPSVTRALLTRNLDLVDVELDSTDVVGVPAESLHWRLFDLGLSLSVRDPRVRVTSLGSGDVTVTIDPTSFGEMIGVPTEIRDGDLYLQGHDEPAEVYVKGLDLVVEHPALSALAGSESVLFPVSDPYMLPCDPGLEMHVDTMVLSCSGSRIPGVLDRVLGGAYSDTPSSEDVDVEIYAPGPIRAGD